MSYSPLTSNNTLEYISPSQSSVNKESSKRKYFADFNSNLNSYSGYLEKKGVTNTIWSKRYFVLNDGILKYYSKGILRLYIYIYIYIYNYIFTNFHINITIKRS
jgi:hypothetical protein